MWATMINCLRSSTTCYHPPLLLPLLLRRRRGRRWRWQPFVHSMTIAFLWIFLIISSFSVRAAFSSTCSHQHRIKPIIKTDLHSTILTPNFPSKFETPFCMEWIIDAQAGRQPQLVEPSSNSNNRKPTVIYLYMNQMYLKTNLSLSASNYVPHFEFDDEVYDKYADDDDEDLDDPVQYSYKQDEHDEYQQQPHSRPERRDAGNGPGGGGWETTSKSPPSSWSAMGNENQIRKDEDDSINSFIKSGGGGGPESTINQGATNNDDNNNHPIHQQQYQPPLFVHLDHYNYSWDKFNESATLMIGPKDCGTHFKILHKGENVSSVDLTLGGERLEYLDLIWTSCRFLTIRVEIYSSYTSHLRVRDHLLDVYGFNISYAVLDASEKPSLDYCSAYKCSYNGHCLVSDDYQTFYCQCHPGHYGRYCEYDKEKCNPAKNITFCRNGGFCKLLGASHGKCFCPPNFSGQQCEINLDTTLPVCPGRRQCQRLCAINQSNHNNDELSYVAEVREFYRNENKMRNSSNLTTGNSNPLSSTSPSSSGSSCSCEVGPAVPKDWLHYEGVLQADKSHNLPIWEYKPTTRIKKRYVSRLSSTELGLKAQIETELTRLLHSVYDEKPKPTKVVVTSFSSQSRFSFHFFGPDSIFSSTAQLLTNLTAAGTLFPNFLLASNFTPQLFTFPQVYIYNNSISPDIPLALGKGFSLTCIAHGSQYVDFKWFKDGTEINATLAVRTITKSPSLHRMLSSWRSTSILYVDHSTTADKGSFTCQVSDFGNQEECKDRSVSVITQPIIELYPLSLTLIRNETGRTVLCAATIESRNNYTYAWYKEGKRILTDASVSDSDPNLLEVTEPVNPYGLILRIVKANESATYTCRIINSVGEGTDSIYIHVLPSTNSPSCRPEVSYNSLKWNLTGLGQTAKIRCPVNYVGFVQRLCQLDPETLKPQWASPDFSRCLSEDLRRINATLKSFVAGFPVIEEFSDIVKKLNKHLLSKERLYAGEGEKVVKVLNDIGDYAVQKPKYIRESNFQTLFFQTMSSLLKFPGSCVHQNSVLQLVKLIHSVSTEFYNTSVSKNPYPIQDDVMVIEHVQMDFNETNIFPRPESQNKYPSWMNVQLYLSRKHPNDTRAGSFFITVLKNITSLIAKNTLQNYRNDYHPHQQYHQHYNSKRDSDSPLGSSAASSSTPSNELPSLTLIGSPIFYFSSNNYILTSSTYYYLSFTLDAELSNQIARRKKNVSCGSLIEENDEHDDANGGSGGGGGAGGDENQQQQSEGAFWLKDNHHCTLVKISGNVVSCRCDRAGKYALLIHTLEQGNEVLSFGLHWAVLVGSVFCILCCVFSLLCMCGHLQCRVGTDGIYVLKVFACFSLLTNVIITLPMMTASEPSLLMSTVLCSCLIMSICCQLGKALSVLLATKSDLFPRLRHITSFNFLLLSTFSCTIPIWISATVYSQTSQRSSSASGTIYDIAIDGENGNNERAMGNVIFRGAMPVFWAFIAVMLLLLTLILVIYYKASTQLKRFRATAETSKFHLIDYKLKTLNRTMFISAGTVSFVSGIILRDWLPTSRFHQYYYGFTALFLGITVLFSYTIHAEYPIPKWLISYVFCAKMLRSPDIEKQSYLDMNSSPSNNNNNKFKGRTPQNISRRNIDENLLRRNALAAAQHRHQQNHQQHEHQEELDDFTQASCTMLPQRFRDNTFSSQNSSELETMETFDGTSLISTNRNFSNHQQQLLQKQRAAKNAAAGLKRTCSSIGSMRRPSTVSFSIPRAMTNPTPNGHSFISFANGGPPNTNYNGRLKTPSSCSCGNCPPLPRFPPFRSNSSGQSDSQFRPRSQSNNSMASLFRFSHSNREPTYAMKRPLREKCRLFGYDPSTSGSGSGTGCEISSFVFPRSNTASRASFANSNSATTHRPLVGPISFVNSSTKLSPPMPRRAGGSNDTGAYVQPSSAYKYPLPTSASSMSFSSGNGVYGSSSRSSSNSKGNTTPTNGVAGGGGGLSTSSSFSTVQPPSTCTNSNKSNDSSNSTLTNSNEYGHQLEDLGLKTLFPKKIRPKNGYKRQLPSLPPSSSFPSTTSPTTKTKHIYSEPNLDAINEKRKRKQNSPSSTLRTQQADTTNRSSTDSQETDHCSSIYSLPRSTTEESQVHENDEQTSLPPAGPEEESVAVAVTAVYEPVHKNNNNNNNKSAISINERPHSANSASSTNSSSSTQSRRSVKSQNGSSNHIAYADSEGVPHYTPMDYSGRLPTTASTKSTTATD